MRERARISVVVPAFNRARSVAACVESIRAQSHAQWEAIIVDDCSSDATAAIAEALARDDARVRLVRLAANGGAQAARNAGVRAAKGDWIAFLDSDDQYLPHSLECRLATALERNVDVVHSECEVLTRDGARRRFGVPPMAGRAYAELLRRPGPMYQGLLVRREALARIGALDEALVAYQEWDTSIRLAQHFELGYVAEPTFLYDCRGNDTISADATRAAKGYAQVLRKHWRSILRHAGVAALARHGVSVLSLERAARAGGRR